VRKEGNQGMAQGKDEFACKPEELFLAVTQVEPQLAWYSLHVLNRRRREIILKIPFMIGVFWK
jgi:hypothetical protein